MEPLNANDAQRYAEFKEWTPYEAALLLAGCKPLPRSHIPEPKGNTPAFNLICAVKSGGPSKNLETSHPPSLWMRWYSEYLAGHDLPEFSQAMMRALDRHLIKAASKKLDQPVPTATDGGDIEAAAPVDKGLVLKKKALIDKHCNQWPTIERDFQDASTNQLSKMAKAPSHGHWFEAAALAWAEQRGKLTKVGQHAAPASPFTGMVHKINR